MEAIDGASVNMPMPSSSDPDWAHLNDLPRPFDVICEDLAALGALSLQDFLSGTTSTAADFDVSFHLQSIVSSSPEKGTSSTAEAVEESKGAGDVAPAGGHSNNCYDECKNDDNVTDNFAFFIFGT
jgi:hypothetical protein